MRASGIFRVKGFQPQHLSLSQQVLAAVPSYECTGKETNVQWNNSSNRPKYIYISGVSINGSMGRECQKFCLRLAQLISEQRDLSQSISSNCIRTKLCFALLRLSLVCLRGSRTICRRTAEFEIDFDVSHTVAKI